MIAPIIRFFRARSLSTALRRQQEFRAELIGATSAWRARRLDPTGLGLLDDLKAELRDIHLEDDEMYSDRAAQKVRSMLDRWQAMKPEMVEAAKHDLGEVWALGLACGITTSIEDHISRTFDLMGELVARNAVNEATKAGAPFIERTIN